MKIFKKIKSLFKKPVDTPKPLISEEVKEVKKNWKVSGERGKVNARINKIKRTKAKKTVRQNRKKGRS